MELTVIMLLVLFFAAGAALGWTLSAMRTKAELIELKTRIKADESARDDLKKRLSEKEEEVESRRLAAELATREKAVAETRMQEAAKNLDEQKRLLEDARQKLSDTFKALSSDSLKDNSRTFLEQAGKVVEPIRETLSKFEKQVTDIEQARRESYGALKGQLDMFNTLQENLQGETRKLVDALKRPQVRGRWGEITLRRVVETAGMNEYCDFTEQVSVDTDEGRLRPDLIVKLPGGKTVVVDAKVPLKAYMEAIESQDDKVREEAVVKHARQVRDHMKLLGTKQYWNQFDPSPDFVVLFLPGESFFSAALETDRDLIVDGIANKVILATPTTLIALLRTVAYSWQQHRMADNAEKIAKAGSELYERICKFLEHLANVRDSLQRATHSFNDAVGSFESRLLPGARRLKDLGAAPADKELPDVGSIDAAPRQLNPQ